MNLRTRLQQNTMRGNFLYSRNLSFIKQSHEFLYWCLFLNFICTGVPHTNCCDCNAVTFYISPNCLLNIRILPRLWVFGLIWKKFWMLCGKVYLLLCTLYGSEVTQILKSENIQFNKKWIWWFSWGGFIYYPCCSFLQNWMGVCFMRVSPHVHTICHVREYHRTIKSI